MKKDISHNEYFKHQISSIINIHNIVTLNYFEFDNNFSYKGERHNFWEFVYVDKGKLTVRTENETFVVSRGECAFHKPNEFHIHSADGVTAPNYFVICFVCNSPYMNIFRGKHFKLSEKQKSYISNIIKEAEQVFDLPHNKPEEKKLKVSSEEIIGGQQMIRTYLEQLLILLLRREYGTESTAIEQPETENYIASQIKRILDMNLYRNISIDELCRTLRYSKSYLSGIFLKEYGNTIHGYITDCKLKEAKALIREHNYNFTQISDMLGFANPLYFSRVFKKKTGMCPSEYKNSVKLN